jgi:hypothetical protein|tara:strand:- start:392 stop:601 length:210 start_codon:yes stop_codon:yes gene_type:complete
MVEVRKSVIYRTRVSRCIDMIHFRRAQNWKNSLEVVLPEDGESKTLKKRIVFVTEKTTSLRTAILVQQA